MFYFYGKRGAAVPKGAAAPFLFVFRVGLCYHKEKPPPKGGRGEGRMTTMKKQELTLAGVPAILYGERSRKVYLYVHGKNGCKEEAERFANTAYSAGWQVLAIDLPEHGARKNSHERLLPWVAVPEIEAVYARMKPVWAHIRLYGVSIGAWLAMQALQGLYAIGSGGIFGVGLGKSMQKLGFVPEAQNDMIFSIVCEETGILGAFLVLFLFGLLIWRLCILALNCRDLQGTLLCAGIMAHMAIQVVLNVAVVTNTIPNTGITLPFVSYGGSSVVFLLGEMGLALSVSSHRHGRIT